MIDDEDMGVRVASSGVSVHADEIVRRVHPFSELYGNIAYTIKIFLLGHVEFVGMESKHVRVELISPSMCLSEPLSTLHKVLWRRTFRHPHRERGCTCLTALNKVGMVLGIAPIEYVVDGTCCAGRGPNRDRAHTRVRSPSEARTSSTAVRTSRRRFSSTDTPLRRAWLRFTPTRRSCSTAGAKDSN